MTKFGKFLRVLGQFFEGLCTMCRNSEPTWATFDAAGKISLLPMAKYWENNLAIWTQCSIVDIIHPTLIEFYFYIMFDEQFRLHIHHN